MSDGATPARGEIHLLTGASGFIGSHIAARLAGEGRRLRCLVRASSDTGALERLGVELVVGDLADPACLRRAADGASRVVHCAALVSDWASTAEILAANVAGTRGLLQAAAGAGVARFVHLSSTDVYSHPGRPAVREGYRARSFGNWYAHSKRLAEQEVSQAGSGRELETVILRPATVYGPGSREVIAAIARAIAARQMLLIDRGRAIAGLCYVENLVDAVILALERPAAAGAAFNVADGLEVTWRELVDDLADELGRPRPRLSIPYGAAYALGFALEHGYRLLRRTLRLRTPALLSRQAIGVLARDQDFDTRSAREVLGWRPRVSYREGLAATTAWLREEYPNLFA